MLNFEEELEKFQPSMDIEKVEDVVYHNNLADDRYCKRVDTGC